MRRAWNTMEEFPFVSTQIVVMGTESHCGTAGLLLPNGERVGVRGDQPLDRNPLTPPLSPVGRGSRPHARLGRAPQLLEAIKYITPP
jgi:hypothetical protein